MSSVGQSTFNFKIDRVAFLLGLAVFVLGLGLRLVGITWGLPNDQRTTSLHPDEPIVLGVARAIQPAQGNFTPGFYNYGTFYMTILRVATDVVNGYGGGPQAKDGSDIPAATARYHLAGRVISAVSGAAIGWVVVALMVPLLGRRAALAAGLACALAPGMVVHSRFQTVDVFATFLAISSLFWAVKIAMSEAPSLKWVGYAAVLAGLSGGTKYTGLLLLIPLLVAVGFSFRGARLVPAIGMAIGATVLAFLSATPGALLQTDAFMRDFKYEALHTSQGHGLTFVSTGPGFVYHLSNLAETVSVLGVVIGGIGLAWAIAKRHRWAVVLVVFAVLYYVLIGRAEVKFLRYVFPLVPLVACGFGAAVAFFEQRGGFWRYANVLSIIALTGVGGGGLYSSILYTQWMSQPDPRDAVGQELVKEGGSVGIPEDAWFWTATVYPEAAVPRGVPFARRLEAQKLAPVPVLQVVDGESRPAWSIRLIDELKPDRITFTSFESDDLQRIQASGSVPAEDKPLVDSFVEFQTALNRDYEVESVTGFDGPKVHDLMYIRPTVWVWKRKTPSLTPSSGS
jgi:hypothetical protein